MTPADAGCWQTGRAGMDYRDLIAGRLGGRIICSVRPSPRLTAQIYISRRQLDLDFTGG